MATMACSRPWDMSRFCANLNFMYAGIPVGELYKAAKRDGFASVESGFLWGSDLGDVVQAKEEAKINHHLINICTGDTSKGELGTAAIPGQQSTFREQFALTLKYAKALDCKMMHIMSGKVANRGPENKKAYLENIRWAAGELKPHSIVPIIEPINPYTVPDYYMDSYELAEEVIESCMSEGLVVGLLCDIFHLQRIKGNIAYSIEKYGKYIKHYQIAQVPDRNEPDTPGELNYSYILDRINRTSYNGLIGLEYKPKGSVGSGLKWIQALKNSPLA